MKSCFVSLLALLIINTPVFGYFTFSERKMIAIKGESCEVLEKQAEAILAWSNRLGELTHMYAYMPACYCMEGGQCMMDVFPLSPKMVQEYQSIKPYYDGPNCWNRSLTFAKILPSLTYSTSGEMSFWMNSPLCVERTLDEVPEAGDIIAVRSFNSQGKTYEIHGFTYISEDISFSKNGYRKLSPFQYYNTSDVFRTYWVDPACQRVYGEPEKGSSCYRRKHARYYSCMSIEEYLENVEIKTSKEMARVYSRLLKIDKELSKIVFTNKSVMPEKPHLKELWDDLGEFKTKAEEELSSELLDEGVIFFWKAIRERSRSLLDQISIVLAL